MVLLRGAEEVDFDESMLTDKQREQVELGIKKVEDFKPRGNIYGDKVFEYRLYDPQLKWDYADGPVDTEMKEKEFMDMVYQAIQEEKVADLDKEEEKEEAVESKKEADVEEEDLF